MSCALHKIGFRATERIVETLDASEWDATTRDSLLAKVGDIHRLLKGLPDEITVSPHDEADLHGVSQSLDQALRAGGDVKELQQHAERVIAIINKVMARVP